MPRAIDWRPGPSHISKKGFILFWKSPFTVIGRGRLLFVAWLDMQRGNAFMNRMPRHHTTIKPPTNRKVPMREARETETGRKKGQVLWTKRRGKARGRRWCVQGEVLTWPLNPFPVRLLPLFLFCLTVFSLLCRCRYLLSLLLQLTSASLYFFKFLHEAWVFSVPIPIPILLLLFLMDGLIRLNIQ